MTKLKRHQQMTKQPVEIPNRNFSNFISKNKLEFKWWHKCHTEIKLYFGYEK